MRTLVLDASAVAAWFSGASNLRAEYEAGQLRVVAPPSLPIDLLDLAAGQWRWPPEKLARLASALDDIGFEYRDPDLDEVARWIGRGLTARHAAYAALASGGDMQLVTDDEELLRIAASVAQASSTPTAARAR